ncbi:hypothetical protein EWM64_g6166 [Hericium alpestre]|uniref:Uncharacterized protein n=1 Tax=Hericium alpestre TaxID=135208 RepID=A0A4Y9ZTE9_9AGAM|nr:hypothetical protein EWM64_g6166 [Hericium alpestre]
MVFEHFDVQVPANETVEFTCTNVVNEEGLPGLWIRAFGGHDADRSPFS